MTEFMFFVALGTIAYFLRKTFDDEFRNVQWHNLGEMKHFEAVLFHGFRKDLETIPMGFSAVGAVMQANSS